MLVWRVWRVFICMLQVCVNLDAYIHRRAASSYLHVAACRIARRRIATCNAQAALPGECISAPAVRSRRKRVEITGCAAAEVCMQQGQPGRGASLSPGFNWSKGIRRRVLGSAAAHSFRAVGERARHVALMPREHSGIKCYRWEWHVAAVLHVARAVLTPRGTMTSTPMGHMTARAYPSGRVQGHALNAEGASMQHDHKAAWACSLAAALHCWRRSGQPPRRHRRRHLRARLHLMQQPAWQACLLRRSSSLGASACAAPAACSCHPHTLRRTHGS